MWKQLFSRRWRWVTLFVVVGMFWLARLGVWQLDRLQQRRAANAQLQEVLAAPPLALTADFALAQLEDVKDRMVMAQGHYDFEREGLIKLQNWQGQTGVHLLTPLVLADGETAVLVDRGWIPESESGLEQRQQFHEAGSVTVEGYVGLSQTAAPANPSASSPPREWYRVNIDQIQAQMPYQLLPIYIIQTPVPGETAEPPFRSPREIDLSEGPHLSYALQWFLFCLMLGGGYLIYVQRQTTEAAAQKG